MNTQFGKVVPIAEVKRIDGKPAVRFARDPVGVWKVFKSEIDAMLSHVQRELHGITRTELLYGGIGVGWEEITYCRQGRYQVLEKWILRLQDYSGIPASELRAVACIESEIVPHFKARKG